MRAFRQDGSSHRQSGGTVKNPYILLELPREEEIAVSEEIRSDSNPGVIIKQIRYRNGLTLILTQDFHNRIFRVEIRAGLSLLFLSRNTVLTVD